jgi:hypothetical protein
MTKVKKEVKKSFDYKTIKSFEDACKHLNLNPDELPEVSKLPYEFSKAILNYYKLCIIYKAINNGWEPNWNNAGEYKYYPWFWVKASGSSPSGFGFSDTDYDFTYTDASVGSRLCTNTSEKAVYIAETFKDEYTEFFLIQK